MKVDSMMVSALWGRVGAAILVIAGMGLNYLGYGFGAEDQVATNDLIVNGLTGLGAAMALFSKIRESKRAE